jgi:hypothetical protein
MPSSGLRSPAAEVRDVLDECLGPVFSIQDVLSKQLVTKKYLVQVSKTVLLLHVSCSPVIVVVDEPVY